MDAMSKIGAHLKSVNGVLRSAAEMDRAVVKTEMENITMMTTHLPDMLPEGNCNALARLTG